MCGLYGIITNKENGFTAKDITLLEQMMVVTSLRGSDSSGLFALPNKDWKCLPKIHKNEGDPYYFLHNDEFKKPIFNMLWKEGKAAIGHGRYATKGAITVKNAHPFRHKHITLVHNGTLYGEKSDETDVEVDSHHLCINIAEKGYKEALLDTAGAFALIWHDAKENAIFIARNSQRDLYQYEGEDSRYIMSENTALYYLLQRNNLWRGEEKLTKFAEGTVYKVDVENKLYRALDLNEEKTKRYQYPRYTNPNLPWTPPAKESPAGGKKVKFIVSNYTALHDRGQVKYFAEGEDKESIVFYTDRELPELISEVGEACIHHSTYINGREEHFVKFRHIVWKKKVEIPEKKIYLITYNSKSIEKKDWLNLAKAKTCSSCKGVIDEEDCHETIVDSKENLMCKDCISQLKEQHINPASYYHQICQ